MKKNLLSGGIIAASIAGLFFLTTAQSSISGKVTPADGADAAWAISGTDSVKGAINSGMFSLQVKTGTYKLIIDAKDPYKDVLLENLQVKDGQPLDVGEIVLQK